MSQGFEKGECSHATPCARIPTARNAAVRERRLLQKGPSLAYTCPKVCKLGHRKQIPLLHNRRNAFRHKRARYRRHRKRARTWPQTGQIDAVTTPGPHCQNNKAVYAEEVSKTVPALWSTTALVLF